MRIERQQEVRGGGECEADEPEGELMSLTNRSADGPKILLALAALLLTASLLPRSALAETQSPQWTVTAVSGPTNFQPAADETQDVAIAAGGGTFTLSYEGQATSAIPYNATPAIVQSALDGLSTIGGAGGNVTVTGGVGDPSGTNPYIVTFEGALAGINVEQLTINGSSLFDTVGDTVSCVAGPEGAFTYQWLRNGQPIVGATSSAYTMVGADAGDAIQCLTTAAVSTGDPASAAVALPSRIIAPVPVAAVPTPPEKIGVGGGAEAGETLTCEVEAGSWGGSPTFTYRWLKNGTPIPGATAESYEVQASDVPSNLQCEAIGTDAGGSVAQISTNRNTSPPLRFLERPPRATAASDLVAITTRTQGGSTGVYDVTVMNTGGASSDGSTITIADTLPSGLSLGAEGASGQDQLGNAPLSCTGLTCTYTGMVMPDDFMTLKIPVVIGPGAGPTVTNLVSVSGGGAVEASVSTPSAVSSTPAGFGIAPGSAATALSSTQAGAHASLTTTLMFNTSDKLNEDGNNYILAGNPRSTIADLPPGFAGDLADTPTCPVSTFTKQTSFHGAQLCPLGTQVGTITLTLGFSGVKEYIVVPVYNLTPNPGEVAKLGFLAAVFNIQGTIMVRPGDYHVRTAFMNIDESAAALDGASLTVWGVPSEHSHDAMRGLICNGETQVSCAYFNSQGEVPGSTGLPVTGSAIPFLTNPTECPGVPLQTTLSSTSWQEPEKVVSASTDIGPLTGCNLLEFAPWLTASPDTTHADTPAGLTADVKVPQEGLTSPEGFSTADIKNTVVTLPAGVVINPGQAAGLVACQEAEAGIGQEGPASCPNGSKVGTDEIETPILKRKLEGNVYVLQSNPPNLKLLVTAYAPIYGIYVKLIGSVHLDEATGQLVTTFANTPELPFSDFKLSFSGGAQAALVTPTGCGTYGTSATFSPWSAPATKGVTAVSAFSITSGPGGSACASPLPFSPSMIAGATTDQAGGFTDFSMLLQRADGQQRISALQFKTPKGLLGMISKVPLCDQADAEAGTCPAASQIGHTVVEAGPGPYPLVVPQPGQPPAPIYLTGGYKGAPYGLSIVVPLVVGPFTLQTQVVRASIAVDPYTAQLTITTDPIPSIVDGIPTDLRAIDAVIDRVGFMFNPTSCAPGSFAGTATSTEGAAAVISSHFQVGSCQSLKFAPNFKVSTSGKTSKADGASLTAKIVYPTGALGSNQASSQSNIASVKVDLPKQLPSRLTTLQKACTAAQFESNPAGCPAASIVGHATAITPVLPVPVTGPAYFVSHGGEAFPSLIVVLQGYGVTVDLVGTTFISKAGITSSTFKTVPDVPVGSFELTLPQGRFSALTANGNLCKATRTVTVRRRVARRVQGRVVHVLRSVTRTVPQPLQMPTGFVAQNGAQFSQTTKIAVTGCPKKATSQNHGKGRTTKKR
jgi:uncharacterized repeat protein (TIGR01451 family)